MIAPERPVVHQDFQRQAYVITFVGRLHQIHDPPGSRIGNEVNAIHEAVVPNHVEVHRAEDAVSVFKGFPGIIFASQEAEFLSAESHEADAPREAKRRQNAGGFQHQGHAGSVIIRSGGRLGAPIPSLGPACGRIVMRADDVVARGGIRTPQRALDVVYCVRRVPVIHREWKELYGLLPERSSQLAAQVRGNLRRLRAECKPGAEVVVGIVVRTGAILVHEMLYVRPDRILTDLLQQGRHRLLIEQTSDFGCAGVAI